MLIKKIYLNRQIIFHLSVIMIFGIMAYANSFSNEFIYDDEHCILKNSYIRDLNHLKEIFTKNLGAGAMRLDNFYRPLQILAYAVIYHIFGLRVFGYHLLNFLLHLGNSFLIYWLLSILFKCNRICFISGLLFILHPVQTETVTYISGTADLLAMFFILLSLIFYLKKHAISYTVSLICYGASLLSKETAVILPFLVILVDFYRREFGFKKIARYVPYFVLMAGYILLRLSIFNFTGNLNLFGIKNIYTENLHYRIFTFLANLLEYYKLLLFPVDLKYDRPSVIFTSIFIPRVLLSLILLVIIFWFVQRSFKKGRVIFLGIIWFYICLSPVSGIVPINAVIMEHWLYLASLGFFIIVAYITEKLNRNLYLTLLLAFIIIFSSLTIKRNKDWCNAITFYNKILQHNPVIARVHNNLAMAYADKGMLKEAEEHYKKAIVLEDRYPEPHHNLARLYLAIGKIEEAIVELKKAVTINDNFIYSHILLKQIYEKLGRIEEANKEASKIKEIISQQKLY